MFRLEGIKILDNTLSLLFPRGDDLKKIAVVLLTQIRDGTYTDDRIAFCKANNCSEQQYYAVRRTLANVGVIKETKEGWKIDTGFIALLMNELFYFMNQRQSSSN